MDFLSHHTSRSPKFIPFATYLKHISNILSLSQRTPTSFVVEKINKNFIFYSSHSAVSSLSP